MEDSADEQDSLRIISAGRREGFGSLVYQETLTRASLDAAAQAQLDEEVEDAIIKSEIEMWERIGLGRTKRRRERLNVVRPVDFASTLWGQMINDRQVSNPKAKMGKEFRRRFRLPFPLFEHLVELCDEYNIFELKKSSKIPTEARVLISLRLLGSGTHNSIISECNGMFIGESTCNSILHQFVGGMTEKFFDVYVNFPTGDGLAKVMDTYRRLGLPGACGSMDCTHIFWGMCPKKLTHVCTGEVVQLLFTCLFNYFNYIILIGKEKKPTLSFQVVVDHNRRAQSVSRFFYGSANDQLVCQNDNFSIAVMAGMLQDIKYELFEDTGETFPVKGAYLIVDGGYMDLACFVDPDHHRMTSQAVRWSEWLESVRKDVECK
jgi:hypothetical protein